MGDSEKENQARSVRAPLPTVCPECRSEQLIRDYEGAEVACAACGLVLSEKIIDEGPEWRAFNAEQRATRSRVGRRTTFTVHDKGLSTSIDWRNQDAYGRALPPNRRAQFYRMRKWQRRARVLDSMERNLSSALLTMSKLCAFLRVPSNVFETAGVFYRKALKQRLIRGRSIQGVSTASVYLACRKCRVARTLTEVATASGMEKETVAKVYRFLRKQLREQVPLSSSIHYISRLTNHLGLTGSVEVIALQLIRAAKEAQLTSGKAPLSIAASAIYIASSIASEQRTQREVAHVTNITEVTVRNRYKDLVENLNITVKL